MELSQLQDEALVQLLLLLSLQLLSCFAAVVTGTAGDWVPALGVPAFVSCDCPPARRVIPIGAHWNRFVFAVVVDRSSFVARYHGLTTQIAAAAAVAVLDNVGDDVARVYQSSAIASCCCFDRTDRHDHLRDLDLLGRRRLDRDPPLPKSWSHSRPC